MARAPAKKRGAVGSRTGLRTRTTIDYNVQTLSDLSMVRKAAPAPKKGAKKAPKKAAVKKGGKKTTATYAQLVLRALRKEKEAIGIKSVINWLEKNYPDKTNRRFVTLALKEGVSAGTFIKSKGSYRLSKKTLDKLAKKKKTTKKPATKKTGTKKTGTKKTTKKTGDKKTTAKKTAKKTATKKTRTEKKEKPSTPKKKRSAGESTSTPSKAAKKVIGPPSSDSSSSVSEASGVWQYYDGGWSNYEATASRIVEGVYQEYLTAPEIHIRPVQSGHFSYSVNFKDLEQENTQTGTKRKIRRV